MRCHAVICSLSIAGVVVSAPVRATEADSGSPPKEQQGPAESGEPEDRNLLQPRSGFILRLYGQGLAGYYGGAFYTGVEQPAIPEAAFGFGGLIGGEIASWFSVGLFGELLLGGVDTDALERLEGFSEPWSMRATVGLSTRFTLVQRRGLRPYIGIDGQRMFQFVGFRSSSGQVVALRSSRTGRTVGFRRVPDVEFESKHEGWAVGPVLGLRVKLTPPNANHVDLFVEAAVVREWWSAAGVSGYARRNIEQGEAAARLIQSLQLEPEGWSTTIRAGFQFGP